MSSLSLPRTIAMTREGSAWLQVLFKVWSLSCVSVSCLLSIQDSINQTLKWHIGVVESQCWASCGGSWYWAHRTPSQPVMSWEHDRAGPSPQEVWDTLVSQFLGSFMEQLRPQGPYGHHGWKFVYQDMICLGREGGWSHKGEGPRAFSSMGFCWVQFAQEYK